MTAKKIWQDSDKLVVVIRELGKHGNVTQAIKTAKAARGWVYGRRQRDRFFRDAFEASRACGIDGRGLENSVTPQEPRVRAAASGVGE